MIYQSIDSKIISNIFSFVKCFGVLVDRLDS